MKKYNLINWSFTYVLSLNVRTIYWGNTSLVPLMKEQLPDGVLCLNAIYLNALQDQPIKNIDWIRVISMWIWKQNRCVGATMAQCTPQFYFSKCAVLLQTLWRQQECWVVSMPDYLLSIIATVGLTKLYSYPLLHYDVHMRFTALISIIYFKRTMHTKWISLSFIVLRIQLWL